MTHPCSRCDALAAPCTDCPVQQKGWRGPFARVLRQIEAKLRRLGLEDDVREELLSATVEGTLRGHETYAGRNGAAFSTWVFSIYANKLRDHYAWRGRNRMHVDLEQGLEVSAPPSPGMDIPELLTALEKLADGAARSCVTLFAQLSEVFRFGRSQKDFAETLGIPQNTLNKRLARCRQWVREVMGDL